MSDKKTSVYRILDANMNRLREGLRTIEEYYRFIENNEQVSITLKGLRHDLTKIEQNLGRDNLIINRDTATDCFSKENRPEELTRNNPEDIVYASFKRTQEAARVIEEYSKVANCPDASQVAKVLRFSLYSLEKTLWINKKND